MSVKSAPDGMTPLNARASLLTDRVYGEDISDSYDFFDVRHRQWSPSSAPALAPEFQVNEDEMLEDIRDSSANEPDTTVSSHEIKKGTVQNSASKLNPEAPVFVPMTRGPTQLNPKAPIFVPRWHIGRGFEHPRGVEMTRTRINSNRGFAHALALEQINAQRRVAQNHQTVQHHKLPHYILPPPPQQDVAFIHQIDLITSCRRLLRGV